MPTVRFVPLLLAGVACLSVAACGGDDDPPPQAAAPAPTSTASETPMQTPTQTAPDQAPTTAAPDADTGSDRKARDRQPSTPDPAGAGDQGAPSTTPKDAPKGDAPAAPRQQESPVGDLQSRLKKTVEGGAPASKDEAADVRESMTNFQEALTSKDGDRICDATVGLPAKNDPKKPGVSCEALSQNGAAKPQSDEERKMIASAKITVKGDRAIAELGEGFPLPFRKVDGRWRLDYGQMMNAGGGSR